MSKAVLFTIGVASMLTGIFIFLEPQAFYEIVPGLNQMGPFSVHFIRDVGLAYFAGGAVLVTGAHLADSRLAIAGSLWFALHGLFHIWIWVHRGLPFDLIFWFDLAAVIIPSTLTIWASFSLEAKEEIA